MAFITAVMVFAEEGILIFTYETALEAAVENSNQPALDDYNIKARQSALEDAREEAKKYFYGGTPQDAAERNIIKQVNPLVAETEVEIAQRRKQDNQEQMKTDVYVEMMRVLLAQESVGLKKERLSLVREKFDIDKVQFREGLISETDISDEELAVSIEELELVRMETSMKADILNIKQKLHLDLSEENRIGFDYSLQRIGSQYVIDSFNIDAAVEKALAADTGVYGKEKAVEAAEMRLEITSQHLKPGNDFYDQKVYELEKAKKELYDTKTNLEVSIRNAYNDLLTASDTLELANKKYDLEQSRMSALKVKYDAGIVSRRDMIESEIKVLDVKLEVLKAICDFNIKHELLRSLVEVS
jgi:outer membrane protein TolC